MTLLMDYETRVEEVDLYFSFASQIDKIETHKKNHYQLSNELQITVKRDLQKVIRANCYLILYNLIESTIRNGLWSVYDAIYDDNVSFAELSDNLQKIWLHQQANEIIEISNAARIKDRINEIVKSQLEKHTIEISKKRISISGNLDYRSIEKIISEHSFHGKITLSDKRKLGKALLKIKNERNALAHGNKSFRQAAEITTIQELTEFKDLTVSYLRDVTKNINSYVERKAFRR